MSGLLTLIGSGETSPGMVKVHRRLLDELGGVPPRPSFLDTPAGFELGVGAIAARFEEYFLTSLGLDLCVVRYHHRDDPPRAQAEALELLAQSNYIVAGPGSPTYAIEHLRGTPILGVLIERWRSGAQLVFASAATISLSRYALPVYEIYKVGRPLYWAEGLDLLGALGLELAIVPHWDNAEGGTHDTRACFMGMERFAKLRNMLPATAVVLGIEEHTAVTLDLERGTAEVQGKGGVSILRGDEQRRRATGEFFALEDLKPPRPAPAPRAAPRRATRPDTPPVPVGQAAELISAGDLAAGFRLAAAGALDDLAALLHQAANAAERLAPSDDSLTSLLDGLLDLRAELRARGEWEMADSLRQHLFDVGIEVRDTPQGALWVRAR